MHTRSRSIPYRRATLRSFVGAAALALALAACGGGALPSSIPTDLIPTFPPDDMASGTAACIDQPTMAVINQLRSAGTNLPELLAENTDILVSGLRELESNDPNTTAWRDALVDALEGGDMDAAADEIARLANDEVTITPC